MKSATEHADGIGMNADVNDGTAKDVIGEFEGLKMVAGYTVFHGC